MISRYYGKRLAIARLRDLANVGREGASMFSLAAAAETLGYSTRAVRTNYRSPGPVGAAGRSPIGRAITTSCSIGPTKNGLWSAIPPSACCGSPARSSSRAGPAACCCFRPPPPCFEQEEQRTTLRRFLPLLKPYHGLLLEVLLASLLDQPLRPGHAGLHPDHHRQGPWSIRTCRCST